MRIRDIGPLEIEQADGSFAELSVADLDGPPGPAGPPGPPGPPGALPIISVVDQGAGGVGGNDTTALQATLNAAPAKSAVFFPSGSYGVTSTLSWNKELTLIFSPGARLTQLAGMSGPVLLCQGSSSVIASPTIDGSETFGTFDAADSERIGIKVDGADKVSVRNPTIGGKSIGVKVLNSTRTRITNPTVTGFGAAGKAMNYHNALRVSGSSSTIIANIHGKAIGSGLLNDASSMHTVVNGAVIDQHWENAIYVSSGVFCTIADVNAYGEPTYNGAGIKVRGNNHTVTGCTVRRAVFGIAVTGNGDAISTVNGTGTLNATNTITGATGSWAIGDGIVATNIPPNTKLTGVSGGTLTLSNPASGSGSGVALSKAEALGANGYGTVVSANVVEDVQQDGILVGAQDSYYGRQFKITANTVRNTALAGGAFAGIRASGHGLQIVSNTLDTCGSTTAMMIVSGASGDAYLAAAKGMLVTHNLFHNATQDCIRATFLDDATIESNRTSEAGGFDLVDVRSVTNSELGRNVGRGMARSVRLDSSCTGNRLVMNSGSIGASADNNYVDHTGGGTPEGAVAASVGSIWRRNDAATSLYVKQTGVSNTGWVAK